MLRAGYLASFADETPEGKSIVELAESFGVDLLDGSTAEKDALFIPFTAQTRMSGCDLNMVRNHSNIEKVPPPQSLLG